MKLIKDRKPNSPGMYAVQMHKNTNETDCFGFAYFDGTGWILPIQSGDNVFPYRNDPVWSVIDWGQD